MTRHFGKTLLATLGLLVTTSAHAYDEDTCSPGSTDPSADGGVGDGGACTPTGAGALPGTTNCFRDPTCADANPLMGPTSSALPYDHSTAHFEMTYLLARCVGVSNAEAVQIAAADEATDMSSPYCGAAAVAQSLGEGFYYNAYACGYEARASNSRGDLDASAVPFYPTDDTHPALRWVHTDRCRAVQSSGSNGLGHGEFFHYPYWQTGASTNSLGTLRAWAFGTSATLIDPAARNGSNAVAPCDMATLPTGSDAGTLCPLPSVLSSLQYSVNSGGRVCNYTYTGLTPTLSQQWSMPAPAPASGTDAAKPFRLGVYLHAVGDSYSHYTCQYYSGQTLSGGSVGEVLVNVNDGGATTHATSANVSTSYNSASHCGAGPDAGNQRPSGVSYDQCVASCDLVSHDLEWGDSSVAQMADSTAVSLLQIRARGGLLWTWTELSNYKNRTDRDNSAAVMALRTSVASAYAVHYDASDRQQYVRDQVGGTAANGYVADSPCMCPNGVYDWVEDANGAGHCATVDALRVATSPNVADAQTTQHTAYTVTLGTPLRLYAYADSHRISGAREDVPVSTISEWTSSNTARFTVNNSPASGAIGTLTPVSAGTATLTVKRLGVTATVQVTVQ